MRPEISVCICTYRRPEGLRDALNSLTELAPATPAIEVIVVDNDVDRSGERSVTSCRSNGISPRYLVEPIKNIARARNRAVAEARAELIAFIDDDEIAEPSWLVELHKTLVCHEADAVFGPVLHRFREPPPKWIRELGFFDYPVPASGTEMPRHLLRSGNVLFKRSAVSDLAHVFDENLGLTGGEDTDLFTRLGDAGAKLVSAQEAVVYETVPVERMGIRWIAQLHYRWGIGKITTSIRQREPALNRLKYFAAAIPNLGWRLTLSLIWYPFARSRSVRSFLKAMYWSGVCAGFLGLRYYPYK